MCTGGLHCTANTWQLGVYALWQTADETELSASQSHKGRIAATARLLAPARCFTPLSLSVSCRGSAVLLRCPEDDDGAPSAATARALLRTRRFATARASSGAVCARDPAPALIAASAWPFVRNRRADPPALAAALGDFSRGLPLGDTRGEARGEAFFFLPSDAACRDARSLDLAPLSGGTRTGGHTTTRLVTSRRADHPIKRIRRVD